MCVYKHDKTAIDYLRAGYGLQSNSNLTKEEWVRKRNKTSSERLIYKLLFVEQNNELLSIVQAFPMKYHRHLGDLLHFAQVNNHVELVQYLVTKWHPIKSSEVGFFIYHSDPQVLDQLNSCIDKFDRFGYFCDKEAHS